MKLSGVVVSALVALPMVCSVLPGCGRGDDGPEAIGSEDDALVTLSPGVWKQFRVRAHGRIRITVPVTASSRYVVSVTDHWGWPAASPRPDVTLDVTVVDDKRRSLTGVSHNTSRDQNALEPDPIPFTAPAAPASSVTLDIVEVDGHGGSFDVRVDPAVVAGGGQPPGLVVHTQGDSATNVSPPTTFAALLAGGGTDHDAATSALVHAGGGGDAVILRMDDTGGAYASYFVERGAHRATEIAFDAQGGNDNVTGAALARLRSLADDSWVSKQIDAAEIVFFAGGNQTKYLDVFGGTGLAAAVNRLVARGGAVGGTSAGMHVLAGVVHTPRGDGNSVTSAAALADPYIDEGEHQGTLSLGLSASPFVVPLLANVITDTHWSQRTRLGRSVAFLARALQDGVRPLGSVSLIACDEGTAVLFDAAGVGRVFAPAAPAGGAAFYFRPDTAPDRCVDDSPLDWRSGVPFVRVAGAPDGAPRLDLSATALPRRVRVDGGALSQQ